MKKLTARCPFCGNVVAVKNGKLTRHARGGNVGLGRLPGGLASAYKCEGSGKKAQ